MLSALLLLFTYDKAHGERSPGHETLSAFRVPVLTQPGQPREPRKFRDDGVVFFNHVVRLTNPPEAATLAFYRGAAFSLPVASKGCDIVVPIYLSKIDVMGFFLLPIKNRGVLSIIASN